MNVTYISFIFFKKNLCGVLENLVSDCSALINGVNTFFFWLEFEKINTKSVRRIAEDSFTLWFSFCSNNYKQRILSLLLVVLLNFLIKFSVSDVPTRNSFILLLEFTLFYKNGLTFWTFGAANTLNFSDTSFPKLTFPTQHIADRS